MKGKVMTQRLRGRRVETDERGKWREVKVNGGRGPSRKRGIVGRVGV